MNGGGWLGPENSWNWEAEEEKRRCIVVERKVTEKKTERKGPLPLQEVYAEVVGRKKKSQPTAVAMSPGVGNERGKKRHGSMNAAWFDQEEWDDRNKENFKPGINRRVNLYGVGRKGGGLLEMGTEGRKVS